MALSFFRKKKPNQKENGALDATGAAAPQNTGQLPEVESENVDSEASAALVEKTAAPGGFFKRLRSGLSKTRKTFSSGLEKIFSGKKSIDDNMLEALEELLITSDIGVRTTMDLMERIAGHSEEISNVEQLKEVLRTEALTFFKETPSVPKNMNAKPYVIMVVGVNGTGKTTTIGKLAARFAKEGKKVLIAAADTFRAAAVEQLTIWAERTGAEIVKHKESADPSAVAFDAMDAATARNVDVVLIDTAGRLHTRVNLMEELKKIKRTISKRCAEAPHEILLVLDATTGQNAISQAKLFNEALGITDIALTKLDGTAKGGIVISICSAFNIPLSYVGVGEKVDDLQEFNAKPFVEALF